MKMTGQIAAGIIIAFFVILFLLVKGCESAVNQQFNPGNNTDCHYTVYQGQSYVTTC